MIMLLAATLTLQDQAAEEDFKKIEEAIREATTVRLRYHAEGTITDKQKTVKVTSEGALLLKGEGKVWFENRLLLDGVEGNSTGFLVSDGEKACTSFPSTPDPGRIHEVIPTPKDLRVRLNVAPARVGILGFLALNKEADYRKNLRGPLVPELAKVGKIADLTSVVEDGARVLNYRYNTSLPDSSEFECALHYDGSGTPIKKRVVVLKGRGGVIARYTETYDEFILNGDIPDEKFVSALNAAEKKIAMARARGTAQVQLSKIRTAIEIYETDTGRYPAPEQGLGVLFKMPEGVKGWRGPYLDTEITKDPWGNAYVYRLPGTRNRGRYDLFSMGPDGKPDTEDDLEPF